MQSKPEDVFLKISDIGISNDLELFQSKPRIRREGHKEPVTVVYFVNGSSIDSDIMDKLSKKNRRTHVKSTNRTR